MTTHPHFGQQLASLLDTEFACSDGHCLNGWIILSLLLAVAGILFAWRRLTARLRLHKLFLHRLRQGETLRTATTLDYTVPYQASISLIGAQLMLHLSSTGDDGEAEQTQHNFDSLLELSAFLQEQTALSLRDFH